MRTCGGTLHWLAPEAMDCRNSFTSACDVYSFGMIMYEVFEERVPWGECQPPQIVLAVASGQRPEVCVTSQQCLLEQHHSSVCIPVRIPLACAAWRVSSVETL